MEQQEEVIFDVSAHLKAHELEQTDFVVAGIRFELLALDGELKSQLKELESYTDILEFAAECGVSVGYKRAMDNNTHKEVLARLWSSEDFEIDEDPCIKYRVGEKVCEISGLEKYIEKVNADEVEADRIAEEERIKEDGELTFDGDKFEESTATTEQMMADRIAAGLPA